MGSDSSATRRSHTCLCRNAETARPRANPGPRGRTAVATDISTLDLGPGLRPLGGVGADVAAPVEAVRGGCRPVVQAVRERLVGGVVLLAEALSRVLASERLRRSLTKPLRDIGVDRRRDDPVHPLVHAVRVL